ncbi:MAG: hypothetical protein KKB65_06535 [Nanoarchaeota archaeon]|nr:hypothetical protein [Nanoarchaeota archaeon]MBU1030865.1 hypothetical protein [Nanoarchaeota archaeon]MBU1850727.1 hypothetical protein [Nanoarchaeota archaeon]
MNEVFVLGDKRALKNDRDVTFSVFGNLKGVRRKTFQEMLSKKGVIASNVPVFITFPYSFWYESVEKKNVMYGVSEFGKSIKQLTDNLAELIEEKFPNAVYVNHPSSMFVERDKLGTKNLLKTEGIKVPDDIDKSVEAVVNEVYSGNPVYIKVRYGSMGKGISYLSQKKWTTNFNYDGKTIRNHSHDKDWKEIDITHDLYFLEQILEEDVVVEKAIINSVTNGFKFDMRARSIFGSCNPSFAYGRATSTQSITNVSQGAERISLQQVSEFVPKEKITEALNLINRSAGVLGLNYAGGDVLFQGDNFDPVILELNSFPGAYMAESVLPNLYKAINKNFLGKEEVLNEVSYNIPPFQVPEGIVGAFLGL